MDRHRLLALSFALAALCSAVAGSRQLKQTSTNTSTTMVVPYGTITGTAIVVARDFLAKRSDKILALRVPSGRSMHIENVDPDTLETIQSGQQIQVTGEIVQEADVLDPTDPGDAVGTADGTVGGAADTPPCNNGNGKGNGNGNCKKRWRLKRVRAQKINKLGGKKKAPVETIQEGDDDMGQYFGNGDPSALPAGDRRRRLQAIKFGAVSPVYISTLPVNYPDLKTIIIPIAGFNTSANQACTGTTMPTVTRFQLRQTMFAELQPNEPTVGSYAKQCSLGKTLLNETTSYVAPIVRLPCSGNSWGIPWSMSTCEFDDFSGYADAADDVLTARGIDLTKYKFRVYLLPPGPCTFVGLGFVGCDDNFPCRAWIGSNFWTTPQAIAHEMGHNMGMGHAGAYDNNGNFDEYLDDTCVMGYCCTDRCPNAPHMWQLGWSQAVLLNGTNLPAGTTLNMTLGTPSFYYRSTIRIKPTWVTGVQQFFLSFRTKTNGDTDLGDPYGNKVHIHQAPTSGSYDSSLTTWRWSLVQGQGYSHPTSQLVIRRAASNMGGIAVVTICRKANNGQENATSCANNWDYNCDGRAGDDDPTCALYR
ncbi:hypothetical protein ABPG75_002802 [Micractinium tetrahymenae]